MLPDRSPAPVGDQAWTPDGMARRPDGVARTPDGVATYLRVRAMEGRLYPDEAVSRLPQAPRSDPLAGEWRQRADSLGRLVTYLDRTPRPMGRPLILLEIGCGNGWLAARLAEIPGIEVIGLDPNEQELGQARRVFAHRPNLRFVAGDVRFAPAPVERPDVIVLASVIQYLADLPGLVRRLTGWLCPGGEIHILDSPLYEQAALGAAGERTRAYYTGLGIPQMAALYHHHAWSELDGLTVEVLYRPDPPGRLGRLLARPRSPFPWVRIR